MKEIQAVVDDLAELDQGVPVYSLDELLAGVTEQNLHHETDTGAPMGREVW